jgi:hypothetical protein
MHSSHCSHQVGFESKCNPRAISGAATQQLYEVHSRFFSNVQVGGFSGSYDNTDKKKEKLEAEGVAIFAKEGNLYVDDQHVFTFN